MLKEVENKSENATASNSGIQHKVQRQDSSDSKSSSSSNKSSSSDDKGKNRERERSHSSSSKHSHKSSRHHHHSSSGHRSKDSSSSANHKKSSSHSSKDRHHSKSSHSSEASKSSEANKSGHSSNVSKPTDSGSSSRRSSDDAKKEGSDKRKKGEPDKRQKEKGESDSKKKDVSDGRGKVGSESRKHDAADAKKKNESDGNKKTDSDGKKKDGSDKRKEDGSDGKIRDPKKSVSSSGHSAGTDRSSKDEHHRKHSSSGKSSSRHGSGDKGSSSSSDKSDAKSRKESEKSTSASRHGSSKHSSHKSAEDKQLRDKSEKNSSAHIVVPQDNSSKFVNSSDKTAASVSSTERSDIQNITNKCSEVNLYKTSETDVEMDVDERFSSKLQRATVDKMLSSQEEPGNMETNVEIINDKEIPMETDDTTQQASSSDRVPVVVDTRRVVLKGILKDPSKPKKEKKRVTFENRTLKFIQSIRAGHLQNPRPRTDFSIPKSFTSTGGNQGVTERPNLMEKPSLGNRDITDHALMHNKPSASYGSVHPLRGRVAPGSATASVPEQAQLAGQGQGPVVQDYGRHRVAHSSAYQQPAHNLPGSSVSFR